MNKGTKVNNWNIKHQKDLKIQKAAPTLSKKGRRGAKKDLEVRDAISIFTAPTNATNGKRPHFRIREIAAKTTCTVIRLSRS
jgi:hypothetical protein